MPFPVDSGSGGVKAIRVSPDGKRLTVVDGTNAVDVYDVDTGRPVQRLQALPRDEIGSEPETGPAAISPDGTTTAVITTAGVSVASIGDGRVRAIPLPTDPNDSYLAAVRIAFAGDTLAVQGSAENVVDFRDVHDGRIVHGAKPNTSPVRRTGYTMRYVPASVKVLPVEKNDGWKLWLARGEDSAGNVYENA